MTTTPFRYDFSLWYCVDDDDIATSIRQILTEQGFQGYVEHQDQVAGQPLVTSVNEIIQASRVAIVLLTPRSVADSFCQRIVEWNLVHTIHQKETKLIPVYVDIKKELMPPALGHLTGLEYGGTFFKQRLLASLQKARLPVRSPRPSGLTGAKSRVGS